MFIHPASALVALSAVTLFQGLLLLALASGPRRFVARPLAFAFVLNGIGWGAFSFYGVWPLLLSVGLGWTLIVLSLALLHQSVRLFAGRSLQPGLLLAGPILWFAAVAAMQGPEYLTARIITAALFCAAYTFLALGELMRLSPDAYPSLRLSQIVVALYGLLHLSRVIDPRALAYPSVLDQPVHTPWIAYFGLMAVILQVVGMFLAISLDREHIENLVTAKAISEGGVLSRATFLIEGRAAVGAMAAAGEPVTLILVETEPDDGRAAAQVAESMRTCGLVRDQLQAFDLCGRLGGERIACLKPHVSDFDIDPCLSRLASLRGRGGAVVGIGVASSLQVGHDLAALLSAAEVALEHAHRQTTAAAAPVCIYHPAFEGERADIHPRWHGGAPGSTPVA